MHYSKWIFILLCNTMTTFSVAGLFFDDQAVLGFITFGLWKNITTTRSSILQVDLSKSKTSNTIFSPTVPEFFTSMSTIPTASAPEDISSESKATRAPLRVNVAKWPEGIVQYLVNATLNSRESAELQFALDEYHEKTCVQFQPWAKNPEESYVSIDRDDSETNPCGNTSVCMRGHGYQYARLRTNCMDKASFIHELGHSLCLSHEHRREDKGDFLKFDGCKIPPKQSYTKHWGVYDYASQMHYYCNSCEWGIPPDPIPPVCGEDAHSGLSVMDVDTVNQMYDCQACNRHRWIPIQDWTRDYIKDMYSFGSVDYLGREVFPCRAFHLGEVAIGMFNTENKICTIVSFRDNKTIIVEKHLEVLTIPGGLSNGCHGVEGDNKPIFQYKLINSLKQSRGNILKQGVRGGSLILGFHNYLEGYIAFGTVSSKYWSKDLNTTDAVNYVGIDVIGTAWNIKGILGDVRFPILVGSPFKLSNYKILVCE